jgi:hypothetical protein
LLQRQFDCGHGRLRRIVLASHSRPVVLLFGGSHSCTGFGAYG